MHLVYFAHSYRDGDVNKLFSELMRQAGMIVSLDPPSNKLNSAKPERHLRATNGMIAVVTAREGGVSPYILYEISLCLRAKMPLLVFVEDTIPGNILGSRVLQRRFSRRGLIRQLADHLHAMRMFLAYIGSEPPPKYQPSLEMRKCLLSGVTGMNASIIDSVQRQLEGRGYSPVLLHDRTPSNMYDTDLQESLNSAELAVAFVRAKPSKDDFALGLIRSGFVPSILLTIDQEFQLGKHTPYEYQARRVDVLSSENIYSIIESEITIAEEDYLDLENQDQVELYSHLLIVAACRGHYTSDVRENFLQEVHVSNQVNNYGGQIGSIGDHSTGVVNLYGQRWDEIKSKVDLEKLAEELSNLRTTLRERAVTPAEDRAVLAVSEAAEQAKQGNGPGTLQKLAASGKWVLNIAQELGIKLIVEILATSIRP